MSTPGSQILLVRSKSQHGMKKQKKFLIQMSGPPGAGKSTLAKTLASRMREEYGVGAVVINHDLVKDFFLDRDEVGGIFSDSTQDGRGVENVSFVNAAKLSYRLDWVLVLDMFLQGMDVVILDSVCNWREVIERGLGLVERWNSGGIMTGFAMDDSGSGCGEMEKDGDGDGDGRAKMEYVYLECRFGNGDGDDLESLDQRLKERAEGGGALRSQRTGVFEGPAGDVGGGGGGSDGCAEKGGKEEETKELFRKWMNPVRPVEGDGAIVVVVDSKNMSAEEGVAVVLREIGLLQ